MSDPENAKYVVTTDETYYPSAMYFDTLVAAQKWFDEVESNYSDSDKYHVTLCKIMSVREMGN